MSIFPNAVRVDAWGEVANAAVYLAAPFGHHVHIVATAHVGAVPCVAWDADIVAADSAGMMSPPIADSYSLLSTVHHVALAQLCVDLPAPWAHGEVS